MAQSFRREGGRITGRLQPPEVVLLRGLVEDVQRLVAEDMPPSAVRARLFPDPALDPDVAADLRGLIEADLREAKRAAARALTDSLTDDGRLSLDDEQAEAWLTALNDLRLAVGTALGITEDYDDDDPDLDVYTWLTFLQGSLLRAVAPGIDG